MTPGDVASAVERATGECPKGVVLLKGVGNNVVAKLEMSSGPRVAKIYFRHPADPRDRLGTEFSMLTFLWESGVRCVPRPFGMFSAESLGLYEYIDGVPLSTADISWKEVEQLIAFLGELYNRKGRPEAQQLPTASEYAPSLADYQGNVSRRFRRLQHELDPKADPTVTAFINGPLLKAYQDVERFLEKQAKSGMALTTVLDPTLRTLSPADHGFQNTLKRQGQLVFLDFEYGGWDDPAQVIANACLHPAVPMPAVFIPRFVSELVGRLGGQLRLGRQLRCLYPLLAFKWCLIMLNEYLPVDRERRVFTGADVENKKGVQLEKSRHHLDKVRESLADTFFLEEMIHGTN
jgi:thiamine kinase-like enzyme